MKRILRFLAKGCVGFLVLSVLWVLLYKWIAIPVTPLMIIRQFNSQQHASMKHEWVPISEISKHLQLAVICSEDQRFVTHNGFDRKANEHVQTKPQF